MKPKINLTSNYGVPTSACYSEHLHVFTSMLHVFCFVTRSVMTVFVYSCRDDGQAVAHHPPTTLPIPPWLSTHPLHARHESTAIHNLTLHHRKISRKMAIICGTETLRWTLLLDCMTHFSQNALYLFICMRGLHATRPLLLNPHPAYLQETTWHSREQHRQTQ